MIAVLNYLKRFCVKTASEEIQAFGNKAVECRPTATKWEVIIVLKCKKSTLMSFEKFCLIPILIKKEDKYPEGVSNFIILWEEIMNWEKTML